MEIVLLFVVFLFTCALFNYHNRLPSSKLLAWVCSLLPRTPVATPSNPAEKVVEEEEEEEDDDAESGSLEADEDDELEGVFSTFDKDGDGFITAKELEESLWRLGIAVTDEEVAAMVERVDSNGDGLIDLGEFRELYAELGRGGSGGGGGLREKEGEEEEMELREAFGVFDGNKDGVITAEELARVLTSLGLKQGAAEDCREMIRRVDMDGDGKVNLEEFKKLMKMKGGRKKLF